MKKIIKALLDIASMFLDVQDLPNNIQQILIRDLKGYDTI